MREKILECLATIEQERDVRVLFACEAGSRAWGFASPDSDYDVRFIYVHKPEWYFRLGVSKDVIERAPIKGGLDVCGWELRKALGLLRKGNVALFEWLDSPVIYRQDDAFVSLLRDAAQRMHQSAPAFHHYINMARRNYREYLCGENVRLKKYLYVLRPVLAALWIEQGRGTPPTPFQKLVDVIVTDDALRAAIEQLVAAKRTAGEAEYGKPLPVLNEFLERELSRLEQAPQFVSRRFDFAVLDDIMFEAVMGGANLKGSNREN